MSDLQVFQCGESDSSAIMTWPYLKWSGSIISMKKYWGIPYGTLFHCWSEWPVAGRSFTACNLNSKINERLIEWHYRSKIFDFSFVNHNYILFKSNRYWIGFINMSKFCEPLLWNIKSRLTTDQAWICSWRQCMTSMTHFTPETVCHTECLKILNINNIAFYKYFWIKKTLLKIIIHNYFFAAWVLNINKNCSPAWFFHR